MKPALSPIYLSAFDEERFAVRTARAPAMTLDNLPLTLDFCKKNEVVFLIARCMAADLSTAQAMEREGFYLMDTLIYYTRDLEKSPIPPDSGKIQVRFIRHGEEENVKIVAAESFRGYFGHYHADERLDRAKCDEAYVDWAFRSCVSHEVADEILIADLNGAIAGFATLRLNEPEEGEGILFGIHPSAQGQGIYRSFIIRGMEWCRSKGASRMIVSTQITNIAVQKVWTRVGFEPSHAYYTFHKWFEAS